MQFNKAIAVLFLLCSPLLSAQVNQEVYVEPEVQKSTTKVLYPRASYDLNKLKSQLEKGSSTIKGEMFARKRNGDPSNPFGNNKLIGGKAKAANVQVFLVPFNAYVADYIRLKHNAEKPKRKRFVQMHDEVFKYRLEGITNRDGNFTFPNLKPGKYYIFGQVTTSQTARKRYYSNGNVATNAYGQVIAEGYSSYVDYSSTSDYVDEVVEIKQNGEVVHIKLTNIRGHRSDEIKALSK